MNYKQHSKNNQIAQEEIGMMIEITNTVEVIIFTRHLYLHQFRMAEKKDSKKMMTVFDEVVTVKEKVKKVDDLLIMMKSLMRKSCMRSRTQVVLTL